MNVPPFLLLDLIFFCLWKTSGKKEEKLLLVIFIVILICVTVSNSYVVRS